MESTLATTTFSLSTVGRTLNPRSSPLLFYLHRRSSSLPRVFQLSRFQFSRIRNASSPLVDINRLGFASSSRRLGTVELRSVRSGYRCVSSSAESFAAADRGFGGNGGNCGGGGGGNGDHAAGGGEAKPSALASGGADDVSAFSSDVITLDVGGMTCGGCAASVKRILESQRGQQASDPLQVEGWLLAQVSEASVNLTTETAIVWPVPEAKVEPNWRRQLGEALAKHLTNCGFKSNLRDSHRENFVETFEKKMKEKHNQLKESGRRLVVSWALCAVCLVGHVSHLFGTKFAWIHAIHSTGFQMSLSLFTLLGPGRGLIVDGLKSLIRGAPNMNTLVGLGALSSFSVSSLAAFLPKLGWKMFFEEPVMLIAFVLLGRSLEQRSKLKAASDMTSLLSILPSKARLIFKDDSTDLSSTVEVSSNSVSVGDQILVLPGDRVPVDGVVSAGRSEVDESSFTGEPLPVTKLPGAEVVAGSVNLNGTLAVKVSRPGGETAMGDIVRLVEEAQTREAPVQRLADKIAGQFTYGVMALSAATFVFWSLFGAQVLPAAFHQASPISLALQLSCSVLVVACPCALGLATPTAVLVGTSLGARRGLLLRGGSVLEKFSMVDTIVFDKTGTLTLGRPVVTKVQTQNYAEDASTRIDPETMWSEADVLALAAGVEKYTNHPIGKAIVATAQTVNCSIAKLTALGVVTDINPKQHRILLVDEGTYNEEPGSGAVAIIEDKMVSVGTLDWIKRHGVDQFPLKEIEDFRNQSTVYVGIDGSLAGIIYVEDQIRADAKHVIESLSNQGIKTYLLSGDKKTAAEYVASVVGIPNSQVFYEVKPEEKRMFISKLQNDRKIVAMVGDGINDTAALALSHVGVAIGGGVGAANEVSSVVLMQNKLSQLLDALELSRLTMKTVKQNLSWAFAYNIVGIPIAGGVLLPVAGTVLTPSIAGALMGLSSVAVMANSLLLRLKFTLRKEETVGASVGIEIPSDANSAVDQK